MVLVYPVISFSKELGHMGSRKNLLGINPTEEKDKLFSNEEQVRTNTPPAFLVHAQDDKTVQQGNSIVFMEALKRNGVDAGAYFYAKGGHGFGLNNPTSNVKWMDELKSWMQMHHWVP